jgi:hypothetical protein
MPSIKRLDRASLTVVVSTGGSHGGCICVSAWILSRRLRRTKLIEVDESGWRDVAVRKLGLLTPRRGRGSGRFWGEPSKEKGRKGEAALGQLLFSIY